VSLLRWLTETCSILYRQATELPSGELQEVWVERYPGVIQQCRIRQRTEATSGLLLSGVSVGDYGGWFRPDAQLPVANDQVVRQSDGRPFAVAGRPAYHGDVGHAMEHWEVTLQRVGD
jgi:hypothetical protein